MDEGLELTLKGQVKQEHHSYHMEVIRCGSKNLVILANVALQGTTGKQEVILIVVFSVEFD